MDLGNFLIIACDFFCNKICFFFFFRSTTSNKYKAARNSNTVKCVTMEWIKDSIAKGYALSFQAYTVKKSTSTPTKENEIIDPDFSIMSAIAAPGRMNEKSILQETANLSGISQINTDTSTLKRKSKFLCVCGFFLFTYK